MKASENEAIWKALADPTRRGILDLLRQRPRTTGELAGAFPLTRFAVMKHMEVLREAGLLTTRAQGRQRIHTLNVVPIRQIYERWVSDYQDLWAGQLLAIKRNV